ncbi:MAG: amidase [Candidatus Competibacterales bacterium]
MSAVEAVTRLKGGDLTPLALIDAAEARIKATDPLINALPIRCFDRARERAKALMAAGLDRPEPGWLAGLPIAVKDLQAVAGVLTTHGSPIYRDFIPERSDLLVERLEANGAVVIAKSNTPEFGAGASTFNSVFGITRNPFDPAWTVGGSSGGAAAALAAGQVWLATGSDLGWSLRTPASFTHTVGLRPTPGRVLHGPASLPWDTLGVAGPMARSVTDLALFLDAMVGEHPEDPLALPAPQVPFQQALTAPLGTGATPLRIAYSPNLGITPVDPEVASVCRAAVDHWAAALQARGTAVELTDQCPDFSSAEATFQVLRAAFMAARHLEHHRQHRDLLKEDLVWNIEKGLGQSAVAVAQAEGDRAALYRRVVAFFQGVDVLACPTAVVPPFLAEERFVDRVGEQRFANYVQWLAITFAISLTGCPALSLPAGNTADGRPIGLQLVAAPRGEAQLLAAALSLEGLGLGPTLPVDPRGS